MERVADLLSMLGAYGQLIVGFLVGCAGTYFKRKLENLASKQDLKGMTDATESVKSKYAKELWVNQQKAIIFREDYKLKLDVYLRAMKVLSKFSIAIEEVQVLTGWREIFSASSNVFKNDPDTHKRMWERYLEYREKAISASTPYNEAVIEFSELKALFSVYFDIGLVAKLNDIEFKGKAATHLLWEDSKFESVLRENLKGQTPLGVAQQKVRMSYQGEWHKYMPDEEINDFYRALRESVKETRVQMMLDY